MRKIVSPVLALLLVSAVVPVAQAFDMCTSASAGSVEVTLTVAPTQVCPGDTLTVSASITNTGNCHDFFLVTMGIYHYEPTFDAWWSQFPGHALCRPLLPMLLVPLTAGGVFDFNYSGTVPNIVPPGEYGLVLMAKGRRTGATDKASARFTVLDCTGVCSDNSECGPDDYCQKAIGDCEGRGHCSARPQACPDVWDPVCGCDGQTYSNACDAAASGVSVSYEGECLATYCFGNEMCHPNEYCYFEECALETGVCMPRPEDCPRLWDPVCGCDGVTYPNACVAAMNAVSVDYPGECTTDPAISCIQSGGTIITGYCCKGSGDFPGICLDGACTCAPEHSELVQMCDCGPGRCFNGSSCVPMN